ncbi:hypothetical protein R6L23_01120 [Streptomyces sp. SR27]|uniref:hypothetical protein n=1 Tax=Streptomyces sp. SR27 TaxID=3076630 RepID=UPI00295B84AA|nr:hypothetical protein [Streptomyces sp. SR27]MDV9186847.1 hypothetical protein [Streptomyces sp. SR27]
MQTGQLLQITCAGEEFRAILTLVGVLHVQEGVAMVSSPRLPESLDEYLSRYLNLPSDFEGRLRADHVSKIALLATTHCDRYLATQHLVSLIAGLPVPTDEPYEDFWFKFWQASGSAYLMPGNMKPSVIAALDYDGLGLADRFLSAFNEMSVEQWDAAATVIGEVLEERVAGPFTLRQRGELWLRDVQLTSWRVLYAAPGPFTWEQREAFRNGWKQA